MRSTNDPQIESNRVQFANLVITFTTAVAISYIIHYTIERPSQQLGKKLSLLA